MAATVVALAASFAAPAVVGWLALGWWWPARSSGPATAVARAGLALGLGLGLVSAWFFLWGMLLGIGRGSVLVGELVLVASLLAQRRGGRATAATSVELEPGGVRSGLLLVAVLAVAAAVAFTAVSATHPFGDGDAMAIWNLRARFLYEAWGDWTLVLFPLGFAHVDYPILLPVLVARAWVYTGGPTVLAPAAVAWVFTFATVAALFGMLTLWRGRAAGVLAAAALLGTPFFVHHGADQAADIPLAFFMVAAVGFSVRRLPVAAAAAAGCAAWCKDEGILFLGMMLIAHLAFERRRLSLHLVGRACLGAALPLAAVLVFKGLAPPSDLLAAAGDAGLWDRATDFTRYRDVAWAVAERLVFLSADGEHAGCGYAALGGYALLAGRDPERAVPRPAVAVLMAMAAAYFAYFAIVSPFILDWHLRTALGRLLLQLWPATLLVAFATLRVPALGTRVVS